MQVLYWLSAAIAATGLVVSLWVHIEAVQGRQAVSDGYFFLLHAGAIGVGILAVFAGKKRKMGPGVQRGDLRDLMRGSPNVLQYLTYIFFIYAILNFGYFFLQSSNGRNEGASTSAMTLRGFSGHWMLFYCAALAIIYPAARDASRR
jgi:hypothetical protein